jgi:hypothetical protein
MDCWLSMILPAVIPLTIIIVYARSKYKERQQLYREIYNDKKEILLKNRWYPVKYATEERFAKIWKILPQEGSGIMCLLEDKILFWGKNLKKESVELEFPIAEIEIKWLGKEFFKNGAMNWIIVDYQGQKYYFTSETGTFIFGTKETTEKIYKELLSLQKNHPVN